MDIQKPANYDIIGDIHGHHDELVKLLDLLGYTNDGICYKHPVRKAIFVGDLIDRGPKIKQTLELVKAMVDQDQALITLGNHEYNAVCYHTQNEKGEWLRPHTEKNQRQIQATSDDFFGHEDAWEDYLDWFRELPLYLDMGDFRVVHACWSQRHIDLIGDHRLADRDFLLASAEENTPEFHAVDKVLKGPELLLPDKQSVIDKGGIRRDKIRVKWWTEPEGKTYRELIFPEQEGLSDAKISSIDNNESWDIYPASAPPVFVGHYWLPPQTPVLFRNVVCLDYSVAKEGFLTSYRWNSGGDLNTESFVTTSPNCAASCIIAKRA